MYCKICGQHLYQSLSFMTLFKWHYEMHPTCEQQLHDVNETITFPWQQLLIDYTYLFEQGSSVADTEYLFTTFYKNIIEKYIEKNEWSILLDLDDIRCSEDLHLIIPLASRRILMVSMFYEQTISEV